MNNTKTSIIFVDSERDNKHLQKLIDTAKLISNEEIQNVVICHDSYSVTIAALRDFQIHGITNFIVITVSNDPIKLANDGSKYISIPLFVALLQMFGANTNVCHAPLNENGFLYTIDHIIGGKQGQTLVTP